MDLTKEDMITEAKHIIASFRDFSERRQELMVALSSIDKLSLFLEGLRSLGYQLPNIMHYISRSTFLDNIDNLLISNLSEAYILSNSKNSNSKGNEKQQELFILGDSILKLGVVVCLLSNHLSYSVGPLDTEKRRLINKMP